MPRLKEFDIIGKRRWWYLLSLAVIIPGIVCMFLRGFNLGIDFTGGNIIEMRFASPVAISDVRASIAKNGLEGSTIQLSGADSSATSGTDVLVRTVTLDEGVRTAVKDELKKDLGAFVLLREEKVGATIGGELIWNAIWATVISWLLIVAYVSLRFEWRFGVASVAALVHDVLVVLALFTFTQKQLDSSFVAAILTIVGYSINDTIVIFDRIRENLKLRFKRGGSLDALVNHSIFQNLTRSTFTTLTSLFTTATLYFFGGDTTKDFAFALLVGFISGCYSSIFVASPLWITLCELTDRRSQQHRRQAAENSEPAAEPKEAVARAEEKTPDAGEAKPDEAPRPHIIKKQAKRKRRIKRE